MRSSLRTRLFVIWIVSLAASVFVGVLLVQLHRQSSAAERGRAEDRLSRGCDLIAERYAFYVAGWDGPVPPAGDAALQRDLQAVAELGLGGFDAVRGGILRDPATAAHPTAIDSLAAAALSDGRPALQSLGATDIAIACPLPGPIPNLAAWVVTRTVADTGPDPLTAGLGVLGLLVLGQTVGLTWLVVAWARHVGRIETALGQPDAAGVLPHLPPTGEAELDRIITALNDAGERLQSAQHHAALAAARAALAERMAALGRVAAGVAHEIRNPIAAMRLRAEGALARDPAADPGRTRAALAAILAQIDRLDRLSGELLAITQRSAPQPDCVDLAAFLQGCAADHAPDGARVDVSAPAEPGWFDRAMIRRALDNLVQNAQRHAGETGRVCLTATREPGLLRLCVSDTGPGVAPELSATLFEPFVTSRADGTGLGLAIAREMAQAHGGTLVLESPGGPSLSGARFTLSLPQPEPLPCP
jgi:signal transduction histidine kinase